VLPLRPPVKPVTLTVIVQKPAATRPPLTHPMLPVPATAVIVPPHVLASPFGVATTSPEGSASVKPTPVSAVPAFGLVSANVSVVVPFTRMLGFPKTLAIVGGPIDMDLGNGSSIAMAMVNDPDGVPLQLIGGRDTRISHVAVNTRDLDASVAYYRDVMGLDVLRTVGAVRQSGALYGLDTDVECRSAMMRDRGSKFMVELIEWLDPLPAAGTDRVRAANDVGLFRMAFSTTDCHGDEAVVRAAGSVPFAPTGTLSVGDHLPLLYVLFWPGPNGECLELIQTGAPR